MNDSEQHDGERELKDRHRGSGSFTEKQPAPSAKLVPVKGSGLSGPFIRRPVMTVLLTLSVIVAGVATYGKLAVNDLPAVDYPVIQVSCSYPGADPTTMANNIATPTVVGNEILVTSDYNRHAIVKLRVTLGGIEELWKQPYPSKVCSPVVHDGHVYLAWQKVRCLDWETGKLKWEGSRNLGDDGSCIVTDEFDHSVDLDESPATGTHIENLSTMGCPEMYECRLRITTRWTRLDAAARATARRPALVRYAASMSRMLKRTRPWRSTSSTFTRTTSPSFSLSLTRSTRSFEICEM